MTKVSVSFEKVLHFRRAADQYAQNHPGQFRPFLYALSKMKSRTKKIEDDFNDKLQLLNIEHCAKDTKGFAEMEKYTVEERGVKKEEERMKFTLEKTKELNIKKRELFNEEVEIDSYNTEDIPDDLGFDWYMVFAPFVVPEEPSEEQLAKLYAVTEKKEEERKAAILEQQQVSMNRR